MYRSHAGDYGPNKPTASLVGLGEKLRWVPWTTQPG
jgi:hypothetical protein